MASIITADTGAVSGTAGLKQSADSSGVLALATGTGTTAVTIDASQNVGIGTSSPGVKLDVFGTIAVRNGNNLYLTETANTAAVGLNSPAASVMAFQTNTLERMRIDSSGNLLVGTTSNNPASRSGTSKFAVAQTGGDTSTLQQSSNSYLNIVSHVSTTSGTRYHIGFGDGTTYGERGVISTNGSTTTYATSSDYRLKENVQPMTGALSVVQQLKPCTYTWKESGADSQGFIAHELQEVVPDAVVGEKDAIKEDGSIQPQAIDTSFLVATLTAAIQEQQALITTLTERISALEAK